MQNISSVCEGLAEVWTSADAVRLPHKRTRQTPRLPWPCSSASWAPSDSRHSLHDESHKRSPLCLHPQPDQAAINLASPHQMLLLL